MTMVPLLDIEIYCRTQLYVPALLFTFQ